MALTLGELKAAIQDKPDDTPVMLLIDGNIKQASAITCAPNGEISVIHTRGGTRKAKLFNTVEDGLICWLHSNGMTNEVIAELLERPLDVVQKRMKKIGLH